MSWSTRTKGPRGDVIAPVTEVIEKSASYDETLQGKAADVSGATAQLIAAAAADCPDDKHVAVETYGHLDHYGMSTYGLTVEFVDPDPAPAAE
jgi:hypothetical protein